MTKLSHGLRDHAHYSRWNSIVQRCYNPNDKAYKAYGLRGIRVDYVWSPQNPSGVENFLKWTDEKIAIFYAEHPQYQHCRVEVARRNMRKDFSPANCLIMLRGESTRHRTTAVLDFDTVVAMRRFKRANPESTLIELAKLFEQSVENVSRAVRGITWTCVNETEPPLTRFTAEEARKVIVKAQTTIVAVLAETAEV